jgi:monoamine oxidase
MRLAGGTGTLPRAIAARLPQDRIHLGARVTGLALDGGRALLTIRQADGGTETVAAAHVIAALPPRLLEASIAFEPGLDPATLLRWRDTPTWMAPHAKFFALYGRAFWRGAGLSGMAQSMVGPMGEIHDATTASGAAALFGFLGVDADRRAAAGRAALTRACLDQLMRLFGPEAGQPVATLLMDWSAEPLTATAEDRRGGAHPLPQARPWVSGPWRERLSLAGSETSGSDPGYLAGAIDAAARAAADVLQRMAKATPGCAAAGTARREAP